MLKKMRRKINTRNASIWIAIVFSATLLIGGCGSATADAVEDVATENTESLNLTEATESLELTEATEAIEVTELTEATETEMESESETEIETETESESESETASESASKKESESEEKTYTYTDLNKTMYAKQSVNIRSLPSTDGNKLGSLKSGQSVTVTGQCNETGWYRISYDGGTGYCSDNYLTSTKPSSGSSSSGSSGSGSSSSGSSSSGSSSNGSSSGSGSSGSGSSSESSGSSSGSSSSTKVTDALLAEYAQEVIDLVNKERKAAGLEEVTESAVLMEAAQIRAEEISVLYSHTRPNGETRIDLIREIDPYIYGEDGIPYAEINGGAAENIAMGQTTPEAVMEDWMNSEGHRGNILDEHEVSHDAIGVGVYYENGIFYWVQLFGTFDEYNPNYNK